MIDRAASFRLTGLPALLVILIILGLIVLGVVTVIRAIARKGREKL